MTCKVPSNRFARVCLVQGSLGETAAKVLDIATGHPESDPVCCRTIRSSLMPRAPAPNPAEEEVGKRMRYSTVRDTIHIGKIEAWDHR